MTKQNLKNENGSDVQCVLAKIIRVATVPPILVTGLVMLIYFFKQGVFSSFHEAALTAFFLGIFPMLAYPFQYVVPKLKKQGRVGQRKLAFIFTIIGYTAGMLWVCFGNVSKSVFLIMFSYFFAALILAGTNVFTKIHASGHGCSAAGVLIYTIWFFGTVAIIPDIILASAIVWASVKMKRHTPLELLMGAIPSFIAFIVGYIIM